MNWNEQIMAFGVSPSFIGITSDMFQEWVPTNSKLSCVFGYDLIK